MAAADLAAVGGLLHELRLELEQRQEHRNGREFPADAGRQRRGEADQRQVPDAELAFVHGDGGILSAHCSLILGRD